MVMSSQTSSGHLKRGFVNERKQSNRVVKRGESLISLD